MKPICKLSDWPPCEGNSYYLIGRVLETLGPDSDESKSFILRVRTSRSYDHVLQIANDYVEVHPCLTN